MIVASCPLTCGELIQGWFDGDQALVSCPIDLEAHAALKPAPALKVMPTSFWKARRALEVLMAEGRCPPCLAELSLTQPVAKGFGTSTAHIAAAAAAAADLGGSRLSPHELARLAVSIEPSDGTMFEGLCLFAHRSGAFAVPLPPPPPMKVVIFDAGGTVDTLTYNSVDRAAALRKMRSAYSGIQDLLLQGLRSGDARAVALAATESAWLNQKFNPKPLLEHAIRLSSEAGGLGVCVAHSGTLIGLLYPSDPDPSALEWVRERLVLPYRGTYSLRAGGVTLHGSCPIPLQESDQQRPCLDQAEGP